MPIIFRKQNQELFLFNLNPEFSDKISYNRSPDRMVASQGVLAPKYFWADGGFLVVWTKSDALLLVYLRNGPAKKFPVWEPVWHCQTIIKRPDEPPGEALLEFLQQLRRRSSNSACSSLIYDGISSISKLSSRSIDLSLIFFGKLLLNSKKWK